MTVSLLATTDCAAPGAICASSDRTLSSGATATVRGPVALSVEDARAEEGTDATIDFTVTLNRAVSVAVTVDYATADGTATAGADYTAASGTLTFAPGETVKTVAVAVLDDTHDDAGETVTLRLSNASGGRVTDGEATGTITNRDPLPRALMARFGRTAALHVVQHVEERLTAPREPGFRGQVAGRELRPGMARDLARDVLSQLGASAGAQTAGATVHDTMAGSPALGAATLGTPGRAGGGAQSQFAGREGPLSLDGQVRTTMVGADYATGPLVAGLSLSNSRSLGTYAGVTDGRVTSAVTGLYPWLGYQATDRISVWGVTGYGAGALRLTPAGGPALKSDLSMAMAAAGTRGELLASGGADGFALAFKADALWVGTAIEGVDGPAGRLAATDAAVTRVRTGLEGSRGVTFARGLLLRPSVEVGLRHDGGDAETGSGVDIGGGLVVSDPSTGLSADVRVRMLLVHEADGFRDRGVSVSFSYNPTPSTPLGFSARVAPSWGGRAAGGAEALWSGGPLAELGASESPSAGGRLEADLGYGLPVGSRLVGTPRIGVGASEMGRDYRLGYSLGVLGGEDLDFVLGVQARRRKSALHGDASNEMSLQATLGS